MVPVLKLDKMDQKKINGYAKTIYAHMAQMFNEESEFHVSLEDIADNNEATDFMYALANTVPALIYAHLTDEKIDILEFNHIMNRLICQNKTA